MHYGLWLKIGVLTIACTTCDLNAHLLHRMHGDVGSEVNLNFSYIGYILAHV